MVKARHLLRSRLILTILPGLLLTAAGCFSQQVVSAIGLEGLAAQQPAPRLALRGKTGSEVLVGPRSHVRFVRANGTYTPWMRAADLWINEEGVLVRHHYPLEQLHEIQIAGLAPEELSLLVQSAPAGGTALPLSQDTVVLRAEGEGLAKWVRSFVVALARQRLPEVFQRFRYDLTLLLNHDPAERCKFFVRDLRQMGRGDILGRWGVAVRDDELFFMDGRDLLRVLDKGIDLLDGLRFSDLQAMEVEHYESRKTAVAVGKAALAAVTVTAAVAASVALRADIVKLAEPSLAFANDDKRRDDSPTGSSLWIAPFPSPSATGARPLLLR